MYEEEKKAKGKMIELVDGGEGESKIRCRERSEKMEAEENRS